MYTLFKPHILILISFFVFLGILYSKKNIKETYVGNLRVANEIDKKRAVKFALKNICQSKGYLWMEYGDEFSYDCKHSKNTCESESVYPTKSGDYPKYYEWRPSNSKDAQNAASRSVTLTNNQPQSLSQQVGQSSLSLSESNINNPDAGGICIMGNETFRSLCEENKLTYNKNDGSCVTNKKYCTSKCLPFCNGDCSNVVNPVNWLSEAVLGTTIGRSINCGHNLAIGEVCNLTNS